MSVKFPFFGGGFFGGGGSADFIFMGARIFLKKNKGNPEKKQGFFSARNPIQSLEQESENYKSKEIENGLEGQGQDNFRIQTLLRIGRQICMHLQCWEVLPFFTI